MVFQSSNGIERNRKAQIIVAVILVVLFCAFFIHTRISKPDESLVNGTYTSACCQTVVMSNGKIKYGDDLSTYRLLNMKFGLTAYVPGSLGQRGLQKQPGEAALIFSENDRSAFKTVIDGREQIFVKR